MSKLPTYDDDQDGGMRLEMAYCDRCANTGIEFHEVNPKTGQSKRIRCTCPKGQRRRRK